MGMNAGVKKKWLEALRSREYKQGTGALRNENIWGETSFCCLGVLCNLHAQEHPNIAKREISPDYYLHSAGFLPLAVARWAGIPKVNRDILPKDSELDVRVGEKTLSELNDGGKKFYQIARYIERHL